MAATAQIDNLVFKNIATDSCPSGYQRDSLLRRIHAEENGKMLVGVDAFIAMWLRLPKFKYLAHAINWPIMRGMTGLIIIIFSRLGCIAVTCALYDFVRCPE